MVELPHFPALVCGTPVNGVTRFYLRAPHPTFRAPKFGSGIALVLDECGELAMGGRMASDSKGVQAHGMSPFLVVEDKGRGFPQRAEFVRTSRYGNVFVRKWASR